MNDSTLKIIGRDHNSRDIIDSYYLAREIGFDTINMDLIIGLPGEGLEEIKNTLREIKKIKSRKSNGPYIGYKRASKFSKPWTNIL